ncbi:hypothetical protein [Paenibacillus pini]|uniref:Uncharacterized protein n=1 Tax=Paenibacillus pini JCM 16418 TaxID=1236976 RepID=W7Z7H0_9BACL|nr:hypothetical protein [Paenibacillus pini]GAF10309.1 hypothetical protein JCM16418_4488 [Paenibacillus pini JCM 16418]
MTASNNENVKFSDMKIMGNGSSAGGTFNLVKIMGDAEINGSITCNAFKCMGNTQVRGMVSTGGFNCTGEIQITEGMRSESAKLNGNLRVLGELSAKLITINGELSVGQRMTAEKVKVNGTLSVAADCQCEDMTIRGSLEVDGMLNVEHLQLKMHGSSKAREVGGSKLHVSRGFSVPILNKLITSMEGTFQAGSIEGDELYLEYTIAKIVRGRHVTLGPGCEIGLVEYAEEFKYDPSASVSQVNQIIV